nr:hypothetical protein [bacterium]
MPLFLLGIGFFIRLSGLGRIPGGLNQDEAFAGYEAWALLTSGTDSSGYGFPVYYQNDLDAGTVYIFPKSQADGLKQAGCTVEEYDTVAIAYFSPA